MSQRQQQHEDFSVEGTQRVRVVRQDRIPCAGKGYKLRWQKQTFELMNLSAFGLAVISPSSLPSELLEATLLFDEIPISEANLKRVREEALPSGEFVSAYTVIGRPIDVEVAQAVQEIWEALETHHTESLRQVTIDPLFRARVLEFKEWLQQLARRVNGLQKDSFRYDRVAVDLFEDAAAQLVARYLSDNLSPVYKEIEVQMRALDPVAAKVHVQFFREQLGPILFQSAYAHRAFSKPKGYAGDYEMMNNVYLRELRGEDLFAKCLQRYFVDEPAGRAVRNRAQYLLTKIQATAAAAAPGRVARILAVASGPAVEIQRLLVEAPEFTLSHPIEFHLMDQDEDALKHAQRRIEELVRTRGARGVSFHYHNLAIKNVIVEGFPDQDFDLIYSAGLFDYLSDPVAQLAATRFYQSLARGGKLIVGNFSLDNPNQFAMGLIMDWHLIYRSESDLKRLFENLSPDVHVEREDLGINLFAVLARA
ncbi:MAG: hypothetical protein AB7G93_06930 [Bdellovibrionales bacterium]